MPRMIEKVSMWFDYPDDPDKGRVEIVSLSDKDRAEITAKSYSGRTVYDKESGEPKQEHTYSRLIDRQETAVRRVQNWENFYGQDGEKMKCTAGALRQWACNDEFMKFVNECGAIVDEKAKEQTEAKRKN